MPAELELREATAPDPFDCQSCGDGAALAMTVFFPGVGDVDGDRIVYTAAEDAALEALADRSAAAQRACCAKRCYLASYDPRQRAATNARRLAALIAAEIDAIVATAPWLRRVQLHLVGFSAGGIVAVHCAEAISCVPRRHPPAAIWCGQAAGEATLEMDLVAMATPFAYGGLFQGLLRAGATGTSYLLELAGSTATFQWSIPSYYAGARPPACLCRFVAFVSSEKHGDDSPGADQDPRDDDRLDEWWSRADPAGGEIPILEVVELASVWPGETVPHEQVPARILDRFTDVLDPECRCVPPPA